MLIIHTEPRASATAGQAFGTATQPVVIYEEDQYGNLETGDNSTVITAKVASGTGPLTGTVTTTVVGGIATFTNLGDNTAGTITVQFTGGGLSSPQTTPIVVSPAAASRLVVSQQPSPGAIAGQAIGTQPVVEEEDPYGNVIASDSSSTVTAARGDVGTSSLLGNNLTVTLVGGVATFSGLSYDKAEAMDIVFTSSAAGVSAATSNQVQVAAAAGQLVIETQPFAAATAGHPLGQPVVYEEDAFGNLITGDNTTLVTATIAGGAGTLQGTTTVTVLGGVAVFSGLSDDTAGTISLVFSTATSVSSASTPIVVAPAAPSVLVIGTQPSPSVTAGQAFAIQPVIYEADAYGNIETSDSTSHATVSLAAGAGVLLGRTTVTLSGGIATFTGLSEDVAGTIALEFTDGGLSSVASVPSWSVRRPPSS